MGGGAAVPPCPVQKMRERGVVPHAKGEGEGRWLLPQRGDRPPCRRWKRVGGGVVVHLCPVQKVGERGDGRRKMGVTMEPGGAKWGLSPVLKVDERKWGVGPLPPCIPCKRRSCRRKRGSFPKVEERERGVGSSSTCAPCER